MAEMDMKEKLVELLDNFHRDLSPFAGNEKLFMVDDNIEQAEYLIAHGVTVQKWIPVAERLPEDLPENKGKKVINCIVAHSPYANGKLTSQFRQRKLDNWDNKWYWSKIGGCTVTHWMPLPQPPKGE